MVETLEVLDSSAAEEINKCLSGSKVCGSELRKAHYNLGFRIGKQIMKNRNLIDNKIAVIIMMRAGLPFGLGISDALESKNDVSVLFSNVNNVYASFETVIIADAVINTGKTILDMKQNLENKHLIVATNVISDKYLDNLKGLDIFATRISQHSYKGSKTAIISNGKGPDTGDRLFDNSFYK